MNPSIILIAMISGFIGGIVGGFFIAWYSVALKRQTEENNNE